MCIFKGDQLGVIAIFCDGTWNSPTISIPTHVYQLYQACDQSPDHKALYFEGVGASSKVTGFWRKLLHKMGGGAFGWGLNANIKEAYQALCQNYQPGDKIMIFGFSRGAYTARSLAGMIRKCGILDTPSRRMVNQAFRLYRTAGKQNAPDQDHVWAARRKLSPNFATSAYDVQKRGDGSHLVRVGYLGIWDTVGALGIPEPLFGPLAALWNGRYRFHDTQLSGMVEAARHAVAIDERRVFFVPSLWDNLDPGPGGPGLNRGDHSPNRPYQQMWFVGDHSIVGGSAEARGLTAFSLAWVLEGAQRLGLRVETPDRLGDLVGDAGIIAPEIDDPSVVYRIAGSLLQWRSGPAQDRDMHPSARDRVTRDPRYRPESLRKILGDLF